MCFVTRRKVLRSKCGTILGRKNVDAALIFFFFFFAYPNRLVCGGENNNSYINSAN